MDEVTSRHLEDVFADPGGQLALKDVKLLFLGLVSVHPWTLARRNQKFHGGVAAPCFLASDKDGEETFCEPERASGASRDVKNDVGWVFSPFGHEPSPSHP